MLLKLVVLLAKQNRHFFILFTFTHYIIFGLCQLSLLGKQCCGSITSSTESKADSLKMFQIKEKNLASQPFSQINLPRKSIIQVLNNKRSARQKNYFGPNKAKQNPDLRYGNAQNPVFSPFLFLLRNEKQNIAEQYWRRISTLYYVV